MTIINRSYIKKACLIGWVLLLNACDYTGSKRDQYCRIVADYYQNLPLQKNEPVGEIYKALSEKILSDKAMEGKISKEKLDEAISAIEQNSNKKFEQHTFYAELGRCKWNVLTQKQAYALNDLRERIQDTYIPAERELFLKRAGGRRICKNITLTNFLMPQELEKPQKTCLYMGDEFLRASQVTSDGVLVNSVYADFPIKHVYLTKGNSSEDNTVDDGRIEPGIFKYNGILSYNSLLGERSIYTFSRIDDPFKDILFYSGN